MQNVKLIKLERDFMFTDIFNQQRNVNKLERFISVYFNIDYDKVHNNLKLIPRKLSKDKLKEARKEVDLLLKLDNLLLKINIEINSSPTKSRLNRNTIYLCKISSSNYNSGDNSYSNIWSSRQINFDDKIYKGNKFINEYIFKEKDTNEVLTDIIQIDIINISMIEKLKYDDLDSREKMAYNFCKLMKTTDEDEFKEVGELIMDKEESIDLLNQVKDKSNDDEYVTLESDYTSEELYWNTQVDDARKEGISKGINQRNIEIAKNMLNKSIDVETISEITNLSVEQVKELNN